MALVPQEDLPEELNTTNKLVPQEDLPDTLQPKPEIKPVSKIATTIADLAGGALSRIGEVTGMDAIHQAGEDIKSGSQILKDKGLEAVGEVPGGSEFTGVMSGLTLGQQETAPLPKDSGMIRQASVAASKLLGMGLLLTPIGRVLGEGFGLPAAVSGAISLGGYGALEKIPSDESRLAHVATMAAFGAAFPLAGSALQSVSSKIPAIGEIFAKIKAGEPLTAAQTTIKKAYEVGQSSLLMGGAGAAEGKTWDERIRNFALGALTGGFAHVVTDAGAKAFGMSKNEVIPVGKKLSVEEALRYGNAPGVDRRLAASVLKRRMAAESPVNAELWEQYVRTKIQNNEPIDPMDFDKSLINAAQDAVRSKKLLGWTPEPGVTYGAGFTMKDLENKSLTFTDDNGIMKTINIPDSLKQYGQVLQSMPEVKSPEQVMESYKAMLEQKPDFLRTAEEKLIVGAKEIPKIEPISAVTPNEPMTEDRIFELAKTYSEQTGKKIEDITPDEMAKLRAGKMAEEIYAGNVPTETNMPEELKKGGLSFEQLSPEEQDRRLLESEIKLSKLSKIPETTETKSQTMDRLMQETVDNPDILIQKGFVKTPEEANRVAENIRGRLHNIIPDMIPGDIEGGGISYDQLKIRMTEKGYGVTDDADKMGMILPSGEGVDMSKGDVARTVSHAQFGRDMGFSTIPKMMRESKMVGISTLGWIKKRYDKLPSIMQNELLIRAYNKPTPEQLMTIQKVYQQTGRVTTFIQNGYDKFTRIDNGTFEEAQKILTDTKSYATEPGEIMGGGWSYEHMKQMGREIYLDGKTTLSEYRQEILKDVPEKDKSQYGEKIVKSFREVSEELRKPPKVDGDGYDINGQRAGGQSNETRITRMLEDAKSDFNESRDNFYSWVNKNYERAKDYFDKTPKTEQQKLADQIVKNMGWFKRAKFKVAEWAKVPVWDAELAPVVNGMRSLTQRAAEIKNGFLKELQFLRHYTMSKEMNEAMANASLFQSEEYLKKLSPQEQEIARKIFKATDWMWGQFEHEWRQNAPYLENFAKKHGFKNADEYITSELAAKKRKLYLPFVRSKGDYVVYMKDIKGNTTWAENFDTVNEAAKRLAELKTNNPNSKVGSFDVRQRYGGYNMPRLVEMLHDLPYMKNILSSRGVSEESVQELDDMFSGAYLDVWAKGRMASREGIKGFNTNWIDVLNDYSEYFPRSFVRRFSSKRLGKLIETVPEDKKAYAMNHIDYYLGRNNYEGKWNFAARNLIFGWNLALKPAFAMINLSQRGQTTFWRALSEIPKGGGGIFLQAQGKELALYKEALKHGDFERMFEISNVLSKTEKGILTKLHDTGEMEAIRNLEIIGRSKFSRVLNIFSTLTEKSNRIQAALVGTEIGIRKGYKNEELFNYVNEFINKTQWMYGKENRPIIGRGKFAPLFVFKTYVLNDMNFLKDIYPDKKVFAGAVAMRLALGGIGGAYGVGAITSAIDAAMIHIVGKKDWEMKKYETMQMLEGTFGKGLVDSITKGLPSLVGIEGSITYGSAELFDIAGIPLFKGTYDNMKMALDERGIDWGEFVKHNSPAIVKHMLGFSNQTLFGKPKITIDDIKHLPPELRRRALEIYRTMPKGMNEKQKFLYSIGFSTTEPNEIYDAINAIKATSHRIKVEKAGYSMQIARAIEERDVSNIKNLMEDARAHGIQISKDAIQGQLKLYRQAANIRKENDNE